MSTPWKGSLYPLDTRLGGPQSLDKISNGQDLEGKRITYSKLNNFLLIGVAMSRRFNAIMEQNPPREVGGYIQIIKKFPASCDPKAYWNLSWASLIQSTYKHPENHFNVALPSTSRSLKLSLPFGFSF